MWPNPQLFFVQCYQYENSDANATYYWQLAFAWPWEILYYKNIHFPLKKAYSNRFQPGFTDYKNGETLRSTLENDVNDPEPHILTTLETENTSTDDLSIASTPEIEKITVKDSLLLWRLNTNLGYHCTNNEVFH